MRVELAEAATEDVEQTLLFYKAPSQPADLFSSAFESATLHLRLWPYTGHRRRDLTQEDVCFFAADPYLIVFRIRRYLLSIVAVLHASRNTARILRRRLRPEQAT